MSCQEGVYFKLVMSLEETCFANVWFVISREWILLATFDAPGRQANSNIYSLWKIKKNSNFRQQITGEENMLFPTQGWLLPRNALSARRNKKFRRRPVCQPTLLVSITDQARVLHSTVLWIPTVYDIPGMEGLLLPTYDMPGRRAIANILYAGKPSSCQFNYFANMWYTMKVCFCQHLFDISGRLSFANIWYARKACYWQHMICQEAGFRIRIRIRMDPH